MIPARISKRDDGRFAASAVQRALHAYRADRAQVRLGASQHPPVTATVDLYGSQIHVKTLQRPGQHLALGDHEALMHGALEALEVLLRAPLLAEHPQVVGQLGDDLLEILSARSWLLSDGRVGTGVR